MLCPHCKQQVEVPGNTASRWFVARNKKRHGPYTWRQLLTLAQRGELKPHDLLLKEGDKQWERADKFPLAFSSESTAQKTPLQVGMNATKRTAFSWSLVGVSVGAILVLLSAGIAAAIYFNRTEEPESLEHATNDTGIPREVKKKKTLVEQPKASDDGVEKKNPNIEKPLPIDTKNVEPSTKDELREFLVKLNQIRKAAGLGEVTDNVELSRGCEAHAKYLALHLDTRNSDLANLRDEDPKKEGYTLEGEQAGRNSIFTSHSPVAALERWMGRVPSRVHLLNPDIQSIGVGVAHNKKRGWFCVADAVRGRGEQVVVYPALNQQDVPISYSGGADIPDAKAAAGFPISVAFPPGKQVRNAEIAVTDAQGKTLDAWIWTPEKPARPGQKLNAMGFIAKETLQPKSQYQVKASAQLDSKAWNLAWSFTTDDDSDGSSAWAKKAVDRVNASRAAAGLKPVVLDGKLSAGCLKHARYLVINDGHPSLLGLNAHKEDLKLPGASPEGNAAGQASNIAIGDYEPIDAVDSWLATLYHRVPVLAPNLRSIGFACVRGRRQGWATVMNVQSGREKSRAQAVFYPAPDQRDVPVSFPNGGEEPNPIPEDPDGRAGFPITSTFPINEPIKNAYGKLTDEKGEDVPCWFSSPEKPANKAHAKTQGNTICLIPKNPLAPKSTYYVEFKGSVVGKAWEKKWTFTTGISGPSPDAAIKSVIERINHYRALAGVPGAVSDESLSRGCQLHAEYLAKNADALLKSKASVNDEDPELPWFTAEGLKSARQSFVFSNAPTPVMQIDDLMATFTSRVVVLDPNLQRIGFGAAHDVGRGWRCVLDPNGGRGDGRIVVYPAPQQTDVPLLGYDQFEQAKGKIGFPVTVAFPQRAVVRNAQATLMDGDKSIDFVLSSPEKPFDKSQRNVVSIHPLMSLQVGRTYAVTVSAIVNGKEWRQSWQFVTVK